MAKKKQTKKKSEAPAVFSPKKIASLVCEVRGERVLLDADLAELYAVETRVLKQAVRRNIDRFPEDFMFELTPEEVDAVYLSRSQSVIVKLTSSLVAPHAKQLLPRQPVPHRPNAHA